MNRKDCHVYSVFPAIFCMQHLGSCLLLIIATLDAYQMCLFIMVILSSMSRQFITSFILASVSPDGLLQQSSTVADSFSFQFSDGVTESVPCSYIEFAERLVLPQYKNLRDEEVVSSPYFQTKKSSFTSQHKFDFLHRMV